MPAPISEEEAESYAALRGVPPEALYRRGVRRRLETNAPHGRQLVIANVASRLTTQISNTGMAALGPERLIRLAAALVDELPENSIAEFVKIIESSDQSSESIGGMIGESIINMFDQDEIKRVAALRLPVMITNDEAGSSRRALQKLDNRLGDASFFRRSDGSESSSDPSDRPPQSRVVIERPQERIRQVI